MAARRPPFRTQTMADQPESSGPAGGRHGYLPYLTWTLLGLLAVWAAVWFFFYRPTTQERLQVASFARALDMIDHNHVETVDRARLYRKAMEGMVEALDDRYAAYLSPEATQQVDERTRGEFGGIGVVLAVSADRPLVEEVLADGPAARAGVEAGDLITHVEGQPLEGLSLQDVVAMVRGEVGTEVELTFYRESSDESLTRTITRETIRMPSVRWEMVEDGIGLLRLASFDRHCAEETRQALGQMKEQGLAGLVIDVRGNGGGLVRQAVLVCDMFLEEGLILRLAGRHVESEPVQHAEPGTLVGAQVPIACLVDRWTASASEILAGTLQAHGRATVVGTPTVGKGSVTSVVPLPDGSSVVFTVAHYELAGGGVIEGNGVEPDVTVGELPPPPEGMAGRELGLWLRERREEVRGEQLQAALRVIRDKLGP